MWITQCVLLTANSYLEVIPVTTEVTHQVQLVEHIKSHKSAMYQSFGLFLQDWINQLVKCLSQAQWLTPNQ